MTTPTEESAASDTGNKKRKIESTAPTKKTTYWLIPECSEEEYEVISTDLATEEMPWEQCPSRDTHMVIKTSLSEKLLREETELALIALHDKFVDGLESEDATEDYELRFTLVKVLCLDSSIRL